MPRPIRFCHLSIFYPPYSFGGDATYLYRLANGLARRGHQVDVIHCADSYSALTSRKPTGDFPNHPNVTLHTLRSRWGILSPLLSQQTGGTWGKTRRIQEVLFSKKFDVIHYHNISLFGPRVLLLEPDYRDFIKLYTTHEHWLICPMHVLWKNNERLCDKPECFRCALHFRRPPQWWRHTKLLEECTPAVDAFLAPSRFTQRIHSERGFPPRLQFLPHFVPALDLLPSPNVSRRPRPFFLFVGRLEKIKGLQNVIPLFRNYSHADLLVAGTGEYEAELHRLAAGMENVVFLGAVPPKQLPALYRDATAVIVPSICYEVFGIVILEAHMQKTPVIANDLGALKEVIEESGGGYTYREPGELLSAMEKIQRDPALRRELGERGYRKVQERWTEEAHLEMYLSALEETARRKLGTVPWQLPQRLGVEFLPEGHPGENAPTGG